MHHCPACSTVLYHQRVALAAAAGSPAPMLDVEGCAGCGGAWLVDGRLAALGREPQAMRKLASSLRATQPPLKPERTDKCPADGAALAPVEYPAFPGIALLACNTCRGVFAAPGQLAAFADRLAPAAEPAPAPIVPGGGGAAVPMRMPPSRAPHVSADPTSTSGLPLVRGVEMPPYTPPTGFFQRFSRGFTFLKAAYALAFQKPTLLVPTVVGGTASIFFSAFGLLAMFVFFRSTGGTLQQGDGDAWFHAHRFALFLFGAVWSLGAYTIGYFFMGMTISMVDAWLKGREPSFGTAFADATKNFVGIIQLAIVSVLVSILVGLVRGDRRSSSISGALVSGIRAAIAKMIEEAWTVLTFLLLPVIMIEDVALPQALSRVRSIHSSNLLQIAVGELGLHLAQRAIGFLVALLLIPLVVIALPMGAYGIAMLVVAVIGIAIVVGTFQSFVRGAYYTCLYLWAVEVERSGANARVPAPLAAALA